MHGVLPSSGGSPYESTAAGLVVSRPLRLTRKRVCPPFTQWLLLSDASIELVTAGLLSLGRRDGPSPLIVGSGEPGR